MSRTQTRFESDSAYLDGIIPLLPGADILATGASGASALTRIAAGEFSLRATAAAAYVIMGGASSLIYRTGLQDNLQENFGSNRAGGAQGLPVGVPLNYLNGSIVAGTNVNVTVFSTVGMVAGAYALLDTVASGVQEFIRIVSITSATVFVAASILNSHASGAPIQMNNFTTPAGASGAPPFTGLSQLTPQTGFRPKGVLIKSLTVAYIISTAAITVPTIGLTSAFYTATTAPVITTMITNATNGLATATQATPYVTVIPVPVANQAWITTPQTAVTVEMDFTNGAGTVDILGFFLGCSFNYT